MATPKWIQEKTQELEREKAKKYLHYEPIVSFEEGLKRTVEFYMKHGFRKKNLAHYFKFAFDSTPK